MSIRERISAQRFAFILAAAVVVIAIIILYVHGFKSSNYEAGIGSPENSDSSLPQDNSAGIAEPDFSYNLTTINIGGTCTPASMLGSSSYGTFNSFASENGSTYFFRRLTDIFREDDLTFVACNAVLSDREKLTPAEKDVLEWYTAPASNALVFVDGCIDVLGLECARTGDYGTEGYSDTKASLEAAGLQWGDIGRAIYKESNGIRIAIYCAKLTESTKKTLTAWTKNARQKNDVIILYVTDTEDSYIPSDSKKEAFRSFIDAGADYVIGTNGTKLQHAEAYGEGYIVYSLGALLDGASKYPEKYTAVLQIKIRSDKGEMKSVSHDLILCETYSDERPWQPYVITDEAVMGEIEEFMRGEREVPVN